MRLISLWVNTAFSTKYGSIFITTSWMGSTTRCILLTEVKPRPLGCELTVLHCAEKRNCGFGFVLLSDRLTERLPSSVRLCRAEPSVQRPLPPDASSSSLIWASLLESASCLQGYTAASAHTTRVPGPSLASSRDDSLVEWWRLNIQDSRVTL